MPVDVLADALAKYGRGPAVPGPADVTSVPPTEGLDVSAQTPGPEGDTVRTGTVLEKFLNVLGMPNNAVAGIVRGAMHGQDPIAGAKYGLANHTTFGSVLSEQGLNGPVAGALGIGLDIALDPLTYLGVGELTSLGKAAKVASESLKVSELLGRTAEHAQYLQKVAALGGEIGATAAERGAKGQQAILSMFGHSVVPRAFNERVFGLTDAVWKKAGETSVGEGLSKLFNSTARLAPEPLRAAYQANRASAGVMTRESIAKLVQPYRDEVAKVAKQAGVEYDVAANIVASAVQGGTSPARIRAIIDAGKQQFGVQHLPSDPLVRATNAINAANSMILGAEKRAGLKISALMGPQNYLKRAVTPEAREAMRAASPELRGLGGRDFATKYGAQIQRDPQLRDLTISEINDMARQGQLKITGFKPVKEFFYEDPFIATAHRMEEGAHAIADISFLKSASRVYGQTFNPLKGRPPYPDGWKTISSGIASDLGLRIRGKGGAIVQDVAFPKEVANLLDNHYERVISPQYMQSFLKAYDSAQGAWKALTLPIWPSYHARNLLSDAWMITATPDGMPLHRLPGRIMQAGKALFDKNPNGQVRLGNKWFTWEGLKQLAESVGVTEQGVGRDLNEIVRHPLAGKPKGLDMITQSAPVQKAIAVGNARENLTRMSYFIERLARGDAPEVAALEVKKRLFQYNDLSDFEKQVMRRVFPFYSWARNNIPFQIQHLIRRPGYGATLEKLREETGTAFGSPDLSQGVGRLPTFLQRGVPLPVGTNAQGDPRFLRLQNIIPLADVSSATTPAALGQFAIDSASPFPKAIAESALNVDLFRSDLPQGQLQRLEQFPGEQTSYWGAPFPARYSPLLDLVRPIAEVNRLNPGGIFGGRYEPSYAGITRDQGDVSAAERTANLLAARTYSVDVVKEANRQQAALRQELTRAQYLLKQALSTGDTVNASQLQRYIDQLVSSPESYTGAVRR